MSQRPRRLVLDDGNPEEVVRFYDELEKSFGIKSRTAKRLVRRGRNISSALWQVIRTQKKPVPGGLLDKLAAMKNGDREKVERLVTLEGKILSQAIKIVCAPTPEAIENIHLESLNAAWARASAEVRRNFLKGIKNRGEVS